MIPELKTVDQQVAAAAVVSGAEQYASEFLIHGASSGEVVPEVAAFLSSQVTYTYYAFCYTKKISSFYFIPGNGSGLREIQLGVNARMI